MAVYKISQEEADSIKAAFRAMDVNGDGKISVNELTRTSKSIGIKLSTKEARDLVNEVDDNGDGYLNFNEFDKMMRDRFEAKHMEDQYITELFKSIDADGNGYLTREDLTSTLKISQDDAQEMIKEADKNKDGRIDLNVVEEVNDLKNGLSSTITKCITNLTISGFIGDVHLVSHGKVFNEALTCPLPQVTRRPLALQHEQYCKNLRRYTEQGMTIMNVHSEAIL